MNKLIPMIVIDVNLANELRKLPDFQEVRTFSGVYGYNGTAYQFGTCDPMFYVYEEYRKTPNGYTVKYLDRYPSLFENIKKAAKRKNQTEVILNFLEVLECIKIERDNNEFKKLSYKEQDILWDLFYLEEETGELIQSYKNPKKMITVTRLKSKNESDGSADLYKIENGNRIRYIHTSNKNICKIQKSVIRQYRKNKEA